MHSAFLISEVRGHILGYLAPPEGPDRRALAALARTCRPLSEPALDVLWYDPGSLEPFLRCSRAKGSDSHETDDEPLHPFNEEEWNIILRYTPRVRELWVSGFYHLEVKVLQALWPRTTLLLPNLQKLSWSHHNLVVIRLLLSPSLRHLKVYLDPTPDVTLEFLECYHTFCPSTSLALDFPSYPRDPSSPELVAVSRAVCHFPHLEALNCRALNEEAFLHCVKSRYLKKLSLSLRNHHPDDIRRLAGCSTPDCPVFENLRALYLSLDDLSDIIPYLQSRQQPFEDISLDFSGRPSSEVYHEFFAALNSPTRRQSLRRIRLRAHPHDASVRSPSATLPQVDFETLSPLLGFSLHTFDVGLQTSISLDDDELASLVRGWTDLEIFKVNELGWDYAPRSPRAPTLRGLLHVLAQCPKLHHIGLFVDAWRIPSLTDEEAGICNKALRMLMVADSPIDSEPPAVAEVTRFLLKHCPSLVGVSWSRYCGPQDTWREVDSQIRAVNMVD